MILFRTLLNRDMWLNPLDHVLGVWGLFDSKGQLTTQALENIVLFIPFTISFLWKLQEKAEISDIKFGNIMWKSIKVTFLFSFIIELLQLFLRLGSFQLSDLTYKTLGGIIGGLTYYAGYKAKHSKKG